MKTKKNNFRKCLVNNCGEAVNINKGVYCYIHRKNIKKG